MAQDVPDGLRGLEGLEVNGQPFLVSLPPDLAYPPPLYDPRPATSVLRPGGLVVGHRGVVEHGEVRQD